MTVYKAVANEAIVTVNLGFALLQGQKPDNSLISKSGWKFSCAYDTKAYNNKIGSFERQYKHKSYICEFCIDSYDNNNKNRYLHVA